MEVSREELSERFESLSDEEILEHLRSGTLTPLAIEVAGDVLRSRGVDPLSSPDPSDSSVEPVVGLDGEGSDLVTVSVQPTALQANLLRALLESHGIFAYVWGEHQASMLVLGPVVRVQVRSDQVSQARELIRALERGELKIPELPDEAVATGQTPASIQEGSASNPYTPPSNPYFPSPATIAAPATQRPSVRPPEDTVGGAGPQPPTRPRAEKRVRTPSTPLRKMSFVAVGLAAALTLWWMFH